MAKKRKKHAWQIALEKEQERLRNRPKIPVEFPRMDPSLPFRDRFILSILSKMMGPGLPTIIILGSPNYSSAQSDIEYWKGRIRQMRPDTFDAEYKATVDTSI